MFSKIKAQKLTIGFFYAAIPTVFLVIRELVYIRQAFIASGSSDIGGELIGFVGLPVLALAICVELFLLYGILVKNRIALVTAVPIAWFEWILSLGVVLPTSNHTSSATKILYDCIAIVAAIASIVIYARGLYSIKRNVAKR